MLFFRLTDSSTQLNDHVTFKHKRHVTTRKLKPASRRVFRQGRHHFPRNLRKRRPTRPCIQLAISSHLTDHTYNSNKRTPLQPPRSRRENVPPRPPPLLHLLPHIHPSPHHPPHPHKRTDRKLHRCPRNHHLRRGLTQLYRRSPG